ncbi:MAG TPA: hypothetical protein V6C89_17155 [Drouetiella sp.]|jgi:hypothetical protein
MPVILGVVPGSQSGLLQNMRSWIDQYRPGHTLQEFMVDDSIRSKIAMLVYKQIRLSDAALVGILIEPSCHSEHEQTSLRNLAMSQGLSFYLL